MDISQSDILKMLLITPQYCLQRKVILEHLAEKYRINKNTSRYQVLNTTLQRRLKQLIKDEYLERHDKGHKQVYYSISETQVTKVKRYLNDRKLRLILKEVPEECIDRFTKIISDISKILLRVKINPKRLLETQVLVVFPNNSYVVFLSPDDKELMDLINRRGMYVGKVTRRHRKVPKTDQIALDDIWMEEGII